MYLTNERDPSLGAPPPTQARSAHLDIRDSEAAAERAELDMARSDLRASCLDKEAAFEAEAQSARCGCQWA